MSDVVNVLRALVADGTEVTILKADSDIRIVAFRRLEDERLVWAIRRVSVAGGNDALGVAFTEIYLQLRDGLSDDPNLPERRYVE